MIQEMRPCPFCGAPVDERTRFQTSVFTTKDMNAVTFGELKEDAHPENVQYCLECAGCEASGPLASSKEAAIEAWNRRV